MPRTIPGPPRAAKPVLPDLNRLVHRRRRRHRPRSRRDLRDPANAAPRQASPPAHGAPAPYAFFVPHISPPSGPPFRPSPYRSSPDNLDRESANSRPERSRRYLPQARKRFREMIPITKSGRRRDVVDLAVPVVWRLARKGDTSRAQPRHRRIARLLPKQPDQRPRVHPRHPRQRVQRVRPTQVTLEVRQHPRHPRLPSPLGQHALPQSGQCHQHQC